MTAVREFSGIDFDLAIGEVYGLRAWRLDKYGRLRALHISGAEPWRPGVNVAECKRDEYDAWQTAYHTVFTRASALYGQGGFIGGAVPPEPERKKSKPPAHAVPDEGCKCGFYAYTDLEHEENKVTPENKYVLGVVKGTGRTLIGTQGFRCEKAEIVALLDPTRGFTRLNKWRREQQRHLRRVYPQVPLLGSRRQLQQFAPIEPLTPSPSDDAFWRLP